MPVLGVGIDARKATVGASEFKSATNSVKGSAGEASGHLQKLQKDMDGTGESTKHLKGILLELGAALGIAMSIRHMSEAIIAFDSEAREMGKMLQLRGEELDDMRTAVIALSRELPVSAAGLASIAAVAGRLGIRGKADVLEFTDAIARFSIVTRTNGEQSAISLGKLLFITGESTKAVGPLTRIIDELSDTTAASAEDILQYASAIARTGSGFRATAAESAALAAMVAQVGGRIEFAGAAISETMAKMNEAVAMGGPQLSIFLNTLGKSREELAAMLTDAPLDAFLLMLDSLNAIHKAGGDVNEVLGAMGLGSTQLDKVLPSLAKNSDAVARAIGHAREEMAKTGQLKISDSLSNQLKILMNILDSLPLLLVASGSGLGEFVKRVNETMRGVQDALASGDATSAARLLWVSIELEWDKGAGGLIKVADRIVNTIVAAFQSIGPIAEEVGWRLVQTLAASGQAAATALWNALTNMPEAKLIRDSQTTQLIGNQARYEDSRQMAIDKWNGGEWTQDQMVRFLKERDEAKIRQDEIIRSETIRDLMGLGGGSKIDFQQQMRDVWSQPLPKVDTVPIMKAMSDDSGMNASLAGNQAEIEQLTAERNTLIAQLHVKSPLNEGSPASVAASQPASAEDGPGYLQEMRQLIEQSRRGVMPRGMYGPEMAQQIGEMEREVKVLRLSIPDRERATVLTNAQIMADKQFTKNKEAATAAVRDYMDVFDEEQSLKGMDVMDEYLRSSQDELRMLQMTNDERTTECELLRLRRQLESKLSPDDLESVMDEARAVEELKRNMEKMRRIADDVGSSFTDAFDGIIMGTKSVADAFKSLAQDIERTIIHNLITKPLGDMISGSVMGMMGGMYGGGAKPAATGAAGLPSTAGWNMRSALGNVFDERGLTAFAAGGVFDSPHIFPFAGGVGLMGEAGPEAIMPLKRGSDGSLGVRAEGAGGPPVVVQVINNSKQQVEAKPGPMKFDGKRYVQQVIIEDLQNFGPIRQAMRGVK